MKLTISELADDFPDFAVAAIIFRGVSVTPERGDALEQTIRQREAACLERWQGNELSQIPGIAVWRQAYRQFGVKKTSYRCSVERLVKNVLAGRELVRINSFVDAYNAVSLHQVFPLGADDLAKIEGDISFRYARDGDSFLPLGREGDGNDPPKPGEVVYADETKVLCRRWNWYQDSRSPVSVETENAILTVQSNGCGDLDAAASDVASLIVSTCGGATEIFTATAREPVVELGGIS